MANNIEEITLHVSENSPYVIGARAYVEQTENGAVITIVDKEGTTTATVTNGRGIVSATLNADYTLTLVYTDGTSVTTSSIRGATGESGVYCGSEEPSNPDVDVWIDPTGDPYPMEDEIAEAVDDWITAHPEYVTTVQDGAITVPKFAAGVVDTALNKTGYPADSKATGDAITADRTRLTAVEGEADALDARITSLATLTEGSTTGDAELIDARTVGSTTYASLHQAIDTEFSNVKSDLLNGLPLAFEEYTGAYERGAYSLVTHAFFANDNYGSMRIKNDGIVAIKYSGVSQVNIPPVAFWSGTPSASTFIGAYGNYSERTEYTDEIVMIPNEAVYITVTSHITASKFSVSTLANKEFIGGENYSYTLQTGGGYSTVTKEWYANQNYKATLIPCEPNDIFVVDTTTNGSIVLALAYSGEPTSANFLYAFGRRSESIESYSNTIIIAPANCSNMAINGFKDYPLSIKHLAYKDIVANNSSGFAVSISDGVLSVKPNRADNGDLLTVNMQKRGGNNLFDFDSITATDSNGTTTIIVTNPTDWIMPYRVKAVSNIDGDNPNSEYFTGGNHRSTNDGTGGVVTAVCDYLKFYVDGVETTNYSGACEEVRVEWQNRVQGYNTTKADGSGRMIMQCNHILTIKDGKFKIRTILTPLESIQLLRYYGYGMYAVGANAYVRYIGSQANRVKTDIALPSNSGDKLTDTVSIENGSYYMDLTLDKSVDLGRGNYAQSRDNDSFVSYNKVYWWIVDETLSMSVGENYYADAVYRFH